jgi:hypothetical protein
MLIYDRLSEGHPRIMILTYMALSGYFLREVLGNLTLFFFCLIVLIGH